MNIGEAAALSGVNAKMIRYYESIGLITPAKRTASNYRVYTEVDLHRLRFIRRARDLGFPLANITALLELWSNQRRSSDRVKDLAQQHIGQLKEQISSMQSVVKTLEELASHANGPSRPEAPVIDEDARQRGEAPRPRGRPRAVTRGRPAVTGRGR